MKKATKFLALALCAALSVSAFSACAQQGDTPVPFEPEVVDPDNDKLSGSINIRVWDGGYGLNWLDQVIVAFNAKYPDVKIGVSDSVERQQVFGDITGKSEKYDIIFSESNVAEYSEECMTPIDDLYTFTAKGEDRTVGEKLNPVYAELLKYKGHYYQIPSYVGAYGFVYNNDYVSDDELPVTTDELKALCENLKNTMGGAGSPFIFSGETGVNYWNFAYCTWFAQYEGRTAYRAALNGAIIDENGEKKIDPSSAYLTGGLKAMQACEDLLWYENGYINTQSTGLQFITAQRDFLKGKAAMMYNGSWMFNEMQTMFPNGTDYDFKMMKVPVISAIREKCATIENDAELAALVRAIDAEKTELKGTGYEVSEADYNTVKEARAFFYAGGENANALIPINARNKELAKRFLAFMYSDAGIKAHASAHAGNVLPVQGVDFGATLDTDDVFLASAYEILGTKEVFFNDPVKAVEPYCTDAKQNSIEKQFGSQSAGDRVRAVTSYNAKKALWTADDNAKFWKELISKGVVTERP